MQSLCSGGGCGWVGKVRELERMTGRSKELCRVGRGRDTVHKLLRHPLAAGEVLQRNQRAAPRQVGEVVRPGLAAGARTSKRALLAQNPGSSTARPKAPPATPRGQQARAGCHKTVVRQRGRTTRPLRWMAAQLKPARWGGDAAQIFLL